MLSFVIAGIGVFERETMRLEEILVSRVDHVWGLCPTPFRVYLVFLLESRGGRCGDVFVGLMDVVQSVRLRV